MLINYKFTDTEIKKILKNVVILVDSREQQNQHILDYFDKKSIVYEVGKLDSGDYSVRVDPLPELQINRPIHFNICIEKKNSVDELASSFKDRTRFENEFIRAKGNNTKMYLLVEDRNGIENILKHNYRSEYTPAALYASLKSWEARYDINIHFENKDIVPHYIYTTLLYHVRDYLLR